MRIHLPSSRPILTSLITFGLALAARSASAQEAGVPTPVRTQESARSDEDLERSARRILHFTAGGTTTGVARLVDGDWQLKLKGGGWQVFPASTVSRAPREADVLRAKKKLAKALGDANDFDRRLAFLQWMVNEGLVNDALREADAILERSPHHAGTLSFLQRQPLVRVPSLEVPREQLPAAREKLYRWAAKAPTAARELAIFELRRTEDTEAVHAELLAGLGNFSIRRRAFCAQAMGRLFPSQNARRLLQHALLDSSAEVRRQASQALGAAQQPGLIVPAIRALSSTNIRVRVQAAEALGFMGYPAAVEPLVGYIAAAQAGGEDRVPHGYIFVGKQTAYIQDFDVEVATFQAVADPQVNVLLEGDVLEAGVSSALEYRYATEARAARTSLGRLTGADAGNTGSAWRKWWSENQQSWKDENLEQVLGGA